MNWYYEQGGQRQGPVPDSEIDVLLSSGAITPATLVWREGMENWAPLRDVRSAPASAAAPAGDPPAGWIRCTATGRYFPPEQIVYIDGKPYSAEAKPAVLQGVLQSGAMPAGMDVDRDGPAWERRDQLGLMKAAWETMKAVLLNPTDTFARMKREGGIGTPLVYNLILSSIGSIVGLAYQFLFNMGTRSMIPADAPQSAMIGVGFTAGMFVGAAIFMPVFIAISTFVGSGLLHLSLMICGGAKQSFETTLRTHCYVAGSCSIVQVVPVCGALVSGIWALVCMCIGISKTHEISVGRAVLAVLLPSIVCCTAAIFIAMAVAGAVIAAQQGGQLH